MLYYCKVQFSYMSRVITTPPRENYDDAIKWEHFPSYWSFVRGIHRSPVDSPHKGQWRGASMFSMICAWTNGWANNRFAGDLRRHRTHYDVIVMIYSIRVPGWVLKCLNLITAPGSVSNQPGSVTWLATAGISKIHAVSWRNHIENQTTKGAQNM